jgi:hypothetical protein
MYVPANKEIIIKLLVLYVTLLLKPAKVDESKSVFFAKKHKFKKKKLQVGLCFMVYDIGMKFKFNQMTKWKN